MSNTIDEVVKAIRELPDYSVIQIIKIKPGTGPVGMTEQMLERWNAADLKALATAYESQAAEITRLTDAMEFIGVTFNAEGELIIQMSKKAKWARAQLAMDDSQIEALKALLRELLPKIEAIPLEYMGAQTVGYRAWSDRDEVVARIREAVR